MHPKYHILNAHVKHFMLCSWGLQRTSKGFALYAAEQQQGRLLGCPFYSRFCPMQELAAISHAGAGPGGWEAAAGAAAGLDAFQAASRVLGREIERLADRCAWRLAVSGQFLGCSLAGGPGRCKAKPQCQNPKTGDPLAVCGGL